MGALAPVTADPTLIPLSKLYLPEADLWLDPSRGKRLAVITHAHADHVAAHETTLCSVATSSLLRVRYGQRGTHVALEYGQPYGVAGYRLELLPAGHILGSAMVHLTRLSDGATLLYTGDFKLRPSPTAEPAVVRRADTLIMETTFGLPKYVFPVYAEIRQQVLAWCAAAFARGQVPILLGYSLGKAQEILRLLNDTGWPIAVHDQVQKICAVYEAHGISFPAYDPLNYQDTAGRVLVMPPHVPRPPGDQYVAAMISGWGLNASAKYQSRTDEVFALSDHADYPDLLKFVERVQPKLTYTTHGFAAEFARDLRGRGWAAWTLEGRDQLDLGLGFD